MASTRKRLAALALAGILPLSVAACGDDDGGGTDEEMNGEEMTEQMTEEMGEEMEDEG